MNNAFEKRLFNIHNTSTKIKPHILLDKKMKENGFEQDRLSCSWLLIKPLRRDAELWFEVWGEGENDYQIEVIKKHDIRPYMSVTVRPKFEQTMLELQYSGIISGYEVGDKVFLCDDWRGLSV